MSDLFKVHATKLSQLLSNVGSGRNYEEKCIEYHEQLLRSVASLCNCGQPFSCVDAVSDELIGQAVEVLWNEGYRQNVVYLPIADITDEYKLGGDSMDVGDYEILVYEKIDTYLPHMYFTLKRED